MDYYGPDSRYLDSETCLSEKVLGEIERIAEETACSAHADQCRKDGNAYITHVEKVVSQIGDDTEARIVAWLHDVSKILVDFRTARG